VALQFGHEALTEAHDFGVALAFGIEIGTPLPPPMGSVVREFLKTCSNARNFRMRD